MTQPTENFPFVRSRDLGLNPSLVSVISTIRSMIGETGDHHWAEQGFVDSGPDGATLLLSSSLAIGDEQDGTHQQILIQAERLDEMEDAWQLWVGYDPSESIVFDDDDIALPAAPSPFSGKRSVFGSSKRWDPDDLSFDKLVDDKRVPALEGNYRIFMAEHRDNECVSPSRPRTACLTVLLQRYNPANQAILGNDWGFHVGRIGSAFDALRSSDGANGDAVLVGKPADSITNVDEEGYWVNVNDQSWLGQPVNTDGSAVRTGPNEWSPLLGSELDREVLAGAMARTLTPYSLLATELTESSNTKGYGWLMTSSGQDHTLGLDRLGRLWAWGGNSLGQLGLGAGGPVSSIGPVLVKTPSPHPGRWMYVSAGNGFSLGIDVDGKAWAWGANGDGQLGDGTVVGKNLPVPVRIDGLTESHPGSWTLVSAGGVGSDDLGAGHSLGIDSNGKIWSWGNNNVFQLGNGTNQSRNLPTPIVDLNPNELLSIWIQVSTASFLFSNHSLAIDSLGRAWAWGDNFYGQLGNDLSGGTSENYESPPDSSVPVLVEVPLGHSGIWVQVSAGDDYSLGLDSNGQGWAWGFNGSGQLGIGSTTQRSVPTRIDVATSNVQTWSQLSAGENHSLGISADSDKLNWGYAWGFNGGSKLGTTVSGNKLVPTRIDVATSNVQTWSQLSAGRLHSLGISADSDKLNWGYAWGSNDANQLGTTVSGNKLVPTRIDVATSNVQTWSQLSAGENHSLGISTDSDKLNWGYAWGLNFNDQLGTTVSGNKLVPTRIDVATSNVQTWSQLSASSNYSLGISADSDKLNWGYAWGNNDRNQLGTTVSGNKLVPTRIDVATSNVQTWSQLSTGGLHSLGISADLNKLNWAYSWGGNDKGQTGLGLQSGNQTKPAKINLNFNQLPNKWLFIDAGAEHSLAISSHNFGWAWGSGLNGKLGNGSNNFQPIPTEIIGSIKWNKLSAGKNHSQGIDDNQNSWGWGSNEQNQLGLGSIYPTFNKIPIKMGLKTELSNFVQISTSNTSVTAFFQNQNTSHSLAIDSLGRAWAWGDNFYGQLGNDLSGGTSENYESPPDSSVPVLVEVPLGHSGIWVQVSAGKDHSVGIDSYGQGWAWGSNYSGQLGNGSTTQRSVPTRIDVATSNVQTWLRLSAGEAYTLGISADSDKLNWGYAWGSNDGGKLGTTVSGNKLVPTRIDVATSNVQTWSQLSAGRLHSLGISADSDKLNWGYAWGSNSDGILGNGTSDSSLYPIRISSIDVQTWLQLYAGYSQSFGISADSNKLNWGYGWGWNGTFQLGNGTQNQTSLPTRINFNSVQTWSQIAPGFVHTLGIAADPDKLNWGYAWGINDAGQLGIGNEIIGESSIPIKIDDSNVSTWFQFSAGDSLSLGISADPNAAWSWGSNRKGQTGLELESGNQFFPVQIQNPISFEGDFISGSAGSKHTILIDIDGKIYTAGSNALGQLGLGNVTIDSEFFTEIEFPSQDSGWVYASAGHQHTVAIDEETGLWSWGSNDSGQLGLGTEEDPIYDPTLSPYLIAWQRTLVSSEIARTKFIRRYGLSPINPNLKLFSTTPGSNQAWIPAGNGSSQLILWRRGIDNEEI